MNKDILVISTNTCPVGYSSALRDKGYRVARVHVISAAYSLLARGFRPQTVILDLKCEDLREALPAMRAILGDKARIIVLTDDRESEAFHPNILLYKPVEAEDVLTAVYTSQAS